MKPSYSEIKTMTTSVAYRHVNIVTRDWRRLQRFYEKAFRCKRIGPVRMLAGRSVSDGVGLTEVVIEGVHLSLPGYIEHGPTLEIFQYQNSTDSQTILANECGFTHIAFEVEKLDEIIALVIRAGGSTLGKNSSIQIPDVGTCTFIYVRDPDGNIIELQNWS